MSNPFELQFTLKQHTPIIHFQHEQPNATLRMTELKPKLDKFLFEKYGNIDKKYHVGAGKSEHTALDYAVFTQNVAVDKSPIAYRDNKIAPTFFANMGDDYQTTPKGWSQATTGIEIEFFSTHTQLITWIKACFEEFLATTNFGTRQSKGWGAFSVEGSMYSNKFSYQFTVKLPNKTIGWQDRTTYLFHHIDIFYRALRSGWNVPDRNQGTQFYCKSLLFVYLKSKGLQWDKKTIKEKYFNYELRQQQANRQTSEPLHFSGKQPQKFLFKELFGLSSEEKWGSYNNATISKKNPEITRFQSPIIFQPILNADGKSYTVHFGVLEEPPKIYREATFDVTKKYDNNHLRLKIASEHDFTFAAFFKFLFDKEKFNMEQHITEATFRKYAQNGICYYEALKDIFSQLQNPKQA